MTSLGLSAALIERLVDLYICTVLRGRVCLSVGRVSRLIAQLSVGQIGRNFGG